MCRSIKTLHNFAPPATDDEIRASALQFVRKLSGFARPSRQNEAAFNRAVDQVTRATARSRPPRPAPEPPAGLARLNRDAPLGQAFHRSVNSSRVTLQSRNIRL